MSKQKKDGPYKHPLPESEKKRDLIDPHLLDLIHTHMLDLITTLLVPSRAKRDAKDIFVKLPPQAKPQA